jgi:hypothetical protein
MLTNKNYEMYMYGVGNAGTWYNICIDLLV